MNTLAIEVQPIAEHIHFSELELMAYLANGRTISVPIAWFASLSKEAGAAGAWLDNWAFIFESMVSSGKLDEIVLSVS